MVATTATGLGAAGCRRNEASAQTRDENPATALIREYSGLPFPPEQIASAINPGKLPVHTGPSGAVRGKITVKGDPPPRREEARPNEARCGKESVELHDKAFRVGPAGELADAIIGVTDYRAFVPARKEAVEVTIKNCAFDRRTIVLSYGQRIDVKNLDTRESYLPHLEGARSPALMVALPQGDAAKIYPPKVGHYMLLDDLKHPWMMAEVFVFKFATAAVSATDGTYKIEGLPAGQVKVSIRHPDIEQTLEKLVQVVANQEVEVNFELTYHHEDTPPPAKAAPGPDIH